MKKRVSTNNSVWISLTALLALLLNAGCGNDESPGDTRTRAPDIPEQITTKSGIQMILIPAGEFMMGDDNGEDDERPAHKVEISAFYMDKYEVTQESYQQLMGRNPAKSKGPNKPVEQIGWLGAIKYCNMRSLREGLAPCYNSETLECDFNASGYRLPTEAEWEYACRAGTTAAYSFGGDPRKLSKYAWFKENSNKTTHPVGQKTPNPWGLYDMHGNVWEWCHDFYAEDYYGRSIAKDPRGPSEGDERVLRGGSWNNTAEMCRSSARYSEPPGLADVCFGYDAYGFRCVKKTMSNAPE